jgi:putative ABC transport system substrate-binding protein
MLPLLALATFSAQLGAAAQTPTKVFRIRVLGATTASAYARQIEAFRQGLRDLGYVEGKNIVLAFRWAEGRYDRLPELAAELIRLKPDVLLTHGTPGTRAAKQATTTIPIVMGSVAMRSPPDSSQALRTRVETLRGRPCSIPS